MRHWFKDQHMRSLLKNSGYLAASRVVAALASIVTLALAGRALGVTEFGLLILLASYAQAASGLGKFNSWQVVVRYGSPALEKGDAGTFQRATGFGLGLDLASGLVMMVVAMLLLPSVAGWIGLPERFLGYALLYCTLLPFMGSAVTGVLRALDRFDLLSWQDTIKPNLRAALSILAWSRGWGFEAFLLIWFATEVVDTLTLWWFTGRELRRRGLLNGIRPSLSARGLAKGWQFAVTVNVNASLNITWGPLGRLLIGAALSPAAAGLYRVASTIAESAQRPTMFLSKAFYPELMRLDLMTKKPWRLMLRVTAVSAMLGTALILLAAVFGEWVIGIAFGADFAPAYPVLLVLLGVPLIAMVTFPLPAMLDALNRPIIPTAANLAGTIVYVLLLFPLAEEFGIIGAGSAFLLGKIAVAVIMGVALAFLYDRVKKSRASISAGEVQRQAAADHE